jgi:hypothetical protein
MTKKFLLQFKAAANTRWLFTDAELIWILQRSCRSAAEIGTAGPVPDVSVITEEECGHQVGDSVTKLVTAELTELP